MRTGSILDRIVDRVRERLVGRKVEKSIRDLEQHPLFDRDLRSLANALRNDRLSIIAEIKRASPSAGLIRNAFDVSEIARSYVEAGAEAISVVTEPDFFKGDLFDLQTAKQTASIPLLRKDFIVDPYQLYEARASGADAVLLICSVLDKTQLAELMDAAKELGLSCLVEVHEVSEIDKLEMDRVDILGVNNRNLKTFEVDTGHALHVLSGMPERIVKVAESGFRSGQDLADAYFAGVDAVLVGEAFMREPDPGAALLNLRRLTEERISEKRASARARP